MDAADRERPSAFSTAPSRREPETEITETAELDAAESPVLLPADGEPAVESGYGFGV